MEIRTASGKTYPVLWADVSTIDSRLRFELTEQLPLTDAAALFEDPEETKTLTRVEDGEEKVFRGFVVLESVDTRERDGTMITLRREWKDYAE